MGLLKLKIFNRFLVQHVKTDYQNGNILITTLLMLVAMGLLGVGILQLAVRQSSLSANKTIDSQLLNITDSCAYTVMDWLGQQLRTPSNIPDLSIANLDNLIIASNNSTAQSKLSAYSYTCHATYITSNNQATNQVGEELGNRGGQYNSTLNTLPTDYFMVTAVGTGSQNSTRTINTIISTQY